MAIFSKLFKAFSPKIKKQFVDGHSYYSQVANWNEWNADRAIQEGFKASVPVYSCIKKRYDAVSSIPLIVEVNQGGEWVREPNHPLQQILNRPNPLMNTGQFMRLLICHLDLAGNAYVEKTRANDNTEPLELWIRAPYPVTITLFDDGMVNYYKIGSHQRRVPAEDICHFMYTNPDNLYVGQAPLQSAGKAVDVDNSAQSWQKVSMQNRGVPDLHIAFDADLDKEQQQQVIEKAKEKSGPGHAREPLVTSKATVKQLSMTPAEMDFMETRRYNREEVCSVYGVPSALIAEMGAVNLANSETARRLFWLDTVIPLMDELIEALNHCLASEYGTLDEVRISYETANVPALQTNYNERVASANTLWSMGVPFNQINDRLQLGFDDIDGGDVGYISAGNIPTSFDFEAGEETEEAKRILLERLTK